MKFTFTSRIVLILSGAVVSGCAGDRVLMATKTNVGLDIDTKPPTAEITIARKEMAILPTFPGAFDNAQPEHNSITPTTNGSADTEQITADKTMLSVQSEKATNGKESTLPMLASFGLEGGFFNPKITGHFAGGDAAVYLAGEDGEVDSTLCLASEKKIDMRSPLLKFLSLSKKSCLD
ncbi:MAG: hypothetical protein M0Q44_17640 [Methylobacter sp.]|jgi:hypothetical protein|nr:hypothetical protein [Methylobacter sp.]